MKIEKIEPKVITYKLTPSKDDEEYMMCMWARFIFDCDNGRLNINSDAGDYSYGWGYNEHEDFMGLMARINSDYLLDKIADRTVFDLEASKKETIENISNYEELADLQDIIEEINDIDINSEDGFFFKVDAIADIDYENIAIVKRFPHGAEVVCDLFTKYIQPQIKKDFSINS